MKKGDYLSTILKAPQTVFSFKDISLLWGDSSSNAQSRISYYIKNEDIYHICRGFYAKDKNYNKYELATKLYTPAYISFETVLAKAGVVFQYYNQIFIASYLTREVMVDGQLFSYRKIKDFLLTNNKGIENKENHSVASPEKAFLDTLYLNKEYYFDNPFSLNKDKVYEILPIYKNKRMEKAVNNIFKAKKNA